jgi:hypothetical protein
MSASGRVASCAACPGAGPNPARHSRRSICPSVAGVAKTGTGACETGGALAGATTAAAGALAPIPETEAAGLLAATGLLAAAGLFLALTGVHTLTRFFLPWTFLVTTLHVFLTLAAAFLGALAFGFFFLRAATILPRRSAGAPEALMSACPR